MDDLISRQAAYEFLSDYYHHRTEMQHKALREALDRVPSAQPKPRWIPVTEKPPEDFEEVNVTWVNHDPEQYYDFVKDKHFTGSAVYYKGSWYWYSSTCVDILAEYGRNEMDKIDDGIEVVAWMPLPEPQMESE